MQEENGVSPDERNLRLELLIADLLRKNEALRQQLQGMSEADSPAAAQKPNDLGCVTQSKFEIRSPGPLA